MAKRKIQYWVGSQGPFIFMVDEDDPESPFRFENVQTRKIERVTTTRTVSQAARVTEHDPISGAEYAAYRAAHFYAYQNG